jgi:hypothetical protein
MIHEVTIDDLRSDDQVSHWLSSNPLEVKAPIVSVINFHSRVYTSNAYSSRSLKYHLTSQPSGGWSGRVLSTYNRSIVFFRCLE